MNKFTNVGYIINFDLYIRNAGAPKLFSDLKRLRGAAIGPLTFKTHPIDII